MRPRETKARSRQPWTNKAQYHQSRFKKQLQQLSHLMYGELQQRQITALNETLLKVNLHFHKNSRKSSKKFSICTVFQLTVKFITETLLFKTIVFYSIQNYSKLENR